MTTTGWLLSDDYGRDAPTAQPKSIPDSEDNNQLPNYQTVLKSEKYKSFYEHELIHLDGGR